MKGWGGVGIGGYKWLVQIGYILWWIGSCVDGTGFRFFNRNGACAIELHVWISLGRVTASVIAIHDASR